MGGSDRPRDFQGPVDARLSRISVTSRTLNARPENLVVATVVTAASPFPRHGSKTPRECSGERRRGRPGGDRPKRPRRRDQTGLAA